MNRFLLFLFLTLSLSCSTSDDSSEPFDLSDIDTDCGTHNGHELHKGPQGGCYYINSSGNKEYVERSLCDC